ncbi:hypothetical protein ACOZ4N_17715 [Halorientalis pallida]|uniref:hypothetical protein n=1 Tax=Halorientalis pallida TaxID=2479928 RepID=UPI003C6ECE06
MVHIGLLETNYHSHILYYIARVADTPDSSVTLFTVPEIEEKIRDRIEETGVAVEWVVADPDESERAFLDRIEPICERTLDVLIVNTISGPAPELYNYIRFDPDCPKLLWIYNVRTWLEPKLSVPRNLKSFLDYNSRTICNQLVRRNYDGLLVQYSPWKTYIERETGYDGPVYAFPRIFYENDETTAEADVTADPPTTVTVPGAIIDKRDYDLVLDAVESRFDADDPVELCLLGRPGTARGETGYGDRILDRCATLDERGYDVTYYRDWIPQSEFNEWLEASDVILSPVTIPKERYGYTELHGQTTGTGAIFDALGYGKPLILPDEYVVGDEIEGLSHQYGTADAFGDLLERFVTDEEFRLSAKRAAFRNGQRFTLDKQQDRFARILDRFLDGVVDA